MKTCGCGRCDHEQLRVKGQLQAADTSGPIPNGIVQLHGGDSTWTEDTGHFTLTAPKGLHRIVLTASDSFGNYVKTTKVIYPAVVSGITYTLITMLRKVPSVSFNGSQEAVLTMGGEQEHDAFAEIHIPPKSVFSDNGSVYTGEVLASLTVIDPRKMTDVINTPSDLTSVDDEGEVQRLRTFGMFNLQLEDPAGKPLQAQGDIELMLDLELLGYNMQDLGDDLPKLWVLDAATGHWVKLSDMKKDQGSFRRKRQTSTLVVGNVNLAFSGEWINYDKVDFGDVCFSSIYLYKTDAFSERISNAHPKVIVRVPNKTTKIYQGYTDNLGSRCGGYCVTHPCDVNSTSNYDGYVYVEYEEQQMLPVSVDAGSGAQGIKDEALKTRIGYKGMEKAISVDFSYIKQQSTNGPFYLWSKDGTSDCMNADDTHNHFRFYVWEKANCQQTEYTKHAGGNVNEIPDANNVPCYAWYTKDYYPDGHTDKRHKVIYIKVKTNSLRNVLFQALSKVGNSLKGCPAKPGEKYGERTGCAKAGEPICLEVKPSGPVFAYAEDVAGLERYDATHLVVQAVKGHVKGMCSGYSLNKNLKESIDISEEFVHAHKFEMKFTEKYMVNKISYKEGVYFLAGDPGDSLEEVKKRALASCKAGCNPETCQRSDTNEDYSALEFSCR